MDKIKSAVLRACLFGCVVFISAFAHAECDPSGPQPQADCYPVGGVTAVNTHDQINVGNNAAGIDYCASERSQWSAVLEYHQEWIAAAINKACARQRQYARCVASYMALAGDR